MPELVYGTIKVAREGLEILAEEALRINLPAPLLVSLAYGESSFKVDWPGETWKGDGGRSVNWFQVYHVHPGWPDRYLGFTGIRESVHLMQDRWVDTFDVCGGWPAYAGLGRVPDEQDLPRVPDDSVPLDPTVPRVGRAAFLYHWWPRAQGSVRPTWQRALECDAVGSAVWEYFQDVRLKEALDETEGRMRLVGALGVAKTEVTMALQRVDEAAKILTRLAQGIDDALG